MGQIGARKRPRGNQKPPLSGGKRRTVAEVQRLTNICDEALSLFTPLDELRRLLGKAAGLDRPMSRRTVDKYIARVNRRHAANPLPSLDKARDGAERRCRRMISRLYADGPVKNSTAIWRWEDRLARLRGLDAPTNTIVSGPEGGPISVRAVPEVVAAFRKLAREPE